MILTSDNEMQKPSASISLVSSLIDLGMQRLTSLDESHESGRSTPRNGFNNDSGFSTPQVRHKGDFAWQNPSRNPILQGSTESTQVLVFPLDFDPQLFSPKGIQALLQER